MRARNGTFGLTRESAVDHNKSSALKRRFALEPEPQLVPITEFFDGNDDEGSIGCNLVPHPGITAFKATLLGLLKRSDVMAVYARIAELDPGEESWPFSDTIVVIGTISPEALHDALESLQPDEVGPADPNAIGHPLSAAEKTRALVAWWD